MKGSASGPQAFKYAYDIREQFLTSRSWRFRMISFEKSIVVLLLEHQTFLELNSFFFSMSEIFMYKGGDVKFWEYTILKFKSLKIDLFKK